MAAFGVLALGVLALSVLAGPLLAGPALANGAAPAGAGGHGGSPKPSAAPRDPKAPKVDVAPVSPLASLGGSPDAWSVSEGEAGCLLLSPVRKSSSRLAIGQVSGVGAGVFVIRAAVAVAGRDATEPVRLRLADGERVVAARLVAVGVLYMPLEARDVAAAVRTVATNGTIWVVIREGWLSHNGQDAGAGAAAFEKACGGKVGV